MDKLGERLPVLGIHGASGSGKDAVATIFVEDFGFHRVAFADFMKEVLLVINPRVLIPYKGTMPLSEALAEYGEPHLKRLSVDYRQLMVRFANDAVKDKMGLNTYWVERLITSIISADQWIDPPKGIVIPDVRSVVEANAVVNLLGGQIIQVNRDGCEYLEGDWEDGIEDYLTLEFTNPGTNYDDLANVVDQVVYALYDRNEDED